MAKRKKEKKQNPTLSDMIDQKIIDIGFDEESNVLNIKLSNSYVISITGKFLISTKKDS